MRRNCSLHSGTSAVPADGDRELRRSDVCDSLLRDFPAFDDKHAINEHGTVGRKAVVERVWGISEAYRSFYDYVNSKPFLDAISALTGMPG